MLGTVDGFDGRQLTVADVPGLIEGASEGIGLGHEFLAHLERARLLLHVIDASEGDADERFAVIDRELAAYGAGLDERPQLVVLNKSDLLPEPAPFSVGDERILAVHRVSCATGAGIDELVASLFEHCPPAEPEPDVAPELPDFLDYRPTPRVRRRFRVLRTGSGFRVVGTVAGRRGARGGAARGGREEGRRGGDRRRGARLGMSGVGILGGAFDPPHNGHVALARAAIEHFRPRAAARPRRRRPRAQGRPHARRDEAPPRRARLRRDRVRRGVARPVSRARSTRSRRSASTIPSS